jgi:hypothetical protein
MRTRFTQPPGVSFLAIGLQTGFARGLEVDNPSGSWLYIPQVETSIPPYTLGWAFRFAYDVSSFDIIAGQSPAGQVSTVQGDPVIVYLTDLADAPTADKIGASPPGFIEQFTPILAATTHCAPTPTTPGSQVLLAAIPGKRFRILTVNSQNTLGGGLGGFDGSSPFAWSLVSTTTTRLLALGSIGGQYWPGNPQTLPVDAPVGEGLTVTSGTNYAAGSGFFLTITYMII